MAREERRWQRARDAEVKHSSHSKLPDDDTFLRQYLDQFGYSLEDIRDRRILSVGAGTGMIHSVSVDCDAVAIDPLSKQFPTEESRAAVLTGMGEYLSIGSETVDFVLCYNVLDHVAKPADVLSEICRTLKPLGTLLLTVNVFEAPKFARLLADYIDPPHPHHFSPAEVESLLKESNLERRQLWVEPHRTDSEASLKAFVAHNVFNLAQIHIAADKPDPL